MYKILVTTSIEKFGNSGYVVSVHTVVVEFDTLDQARAAVNAIRAQHWTRDVRQEVTPLFNIK